MSSCTYTRLSNRRRADGAQAPPASGPVEREVRRHHVCCSTSPCTSDDFMKTGIVPEQRAVVRFDKDWKVSGNTDDDDLDIALRKRSTAPLSVNIPSQYA